MPRPRGRARHGSSGTRAPDRRGQAPSASAASTRARDPVSGGALRRRAGANTVEHDPAERRRWRSSRGRGRATASGAAGPRHRRSTRRRPRRRPDDPARPGRRGRGRGCVRSTCRRRRRRTRPRRHRARSARRRGGGSWRSRFRIVAVGRRRWSSETPNRPPDGRRPILVGDGPASAPGRCGVRPGRRPRRGPRGRGRASSTSGLDPEAEQEVDDLHDHERADGRRTGRVAPTASACVHDLLRVAVDRGRSRPPGRRRTAKTPVAMAPNMPPTPWTAKTSSASSTRDRSRRSVAL